MARHRRLRADDIDRTHPVDGRIPDGDTVLSAGHERWSDRVVRFPTATNPDPPAELVRPYVTQQEGDRWPQS
jgi:hypothetical protein